MDPKRPLVPVLSWDTEREDRLHTNLLRSPGLRLRTRSGTDWVEGSELSANVQDLSHGARYAFQLSNGVFHWKIEASRDGFQMSFFLEGTWDLRLGKVELLFPFDPGITPTTVLPREWQDDGTFASPFIISAPDFGQMLLEVKADDQVKGRFVGSRVDHITDLILQFAPQARHLVIVSLTPVWLAPPQQLQDQSMWPLARRGWFNVFQPGASWGTESDHFQAGIPGILANNVISDPCSLSQAFYADLMLWTPEVGPDISTAQLVRRTVDYWLEKRTLQSHEAMGYNDYVNFLDANPFLLISAWDYVEATQDINWLKEKVDRLEGLAEFLALRDQDQDGLVEATQSGNAGTFWDPNRSSNWFDAVNYGHKDAYTNALIYRAWRCLADLEDKLGRSCQQVRYTGLANKLKAAYARELFNPQTGWFACWKSADGNLHDYASPIISGMAISYGIVGQEQGRQILDRLWAKMQKAGFHRFDLGIPSLLEPVHLSDYRRPAAQWRQCVPMGGKCAGLPTRENGTDTFQWYQNAGIAAGHTLYFLVANYVVGNNEKADQVLRAMLERQQKGLFQNGVRGDYPHGAEFTTWEGQTCGYEGYLADSYFFLLAVLLREPALRTRHYRPLLTA